MALQMQIKNKGSKKLTVVVVKGRGQMQCKFPSIQLKAEGRGCEILISKTESDVWQRGEATADRRPVKACQCGPVWG